MDVLNYVFKITDADDHLKTYNLLNTASVVQGLRTGCIIAHIDNNYIEELIYMLDKNNVYAKVYPISKQDGVSNILLLRKGIEELTSLFHKLKDHSNKNFDTHVGKIIGYFHPTPLHNLKPLKKMYISVELKLPNDTVETLHFFPQKIKNTNNATLDRLADVEEGLYNLKFPKGFRLLHTQRVII